MLKENKWYLLNRYIGEEEGYTRLPQKPGNYAIYVINVYGQNKELLYIGTARNLKERLRSHEVLRGIHMLLDVCWLNLPFTTTIIKLKVVNDRCLREEQERRLIRRLKPRGNTFLYGTQ